jgi:predicted amidohydrolase
MDGDEAVDEARLKEEEVDDREVDNATTATATTTTTAQPEPAQKVLNAHVVVDPLGRIAAVYRKIHLFDVDVPNGPVLLESRTTAPGDRLVVVPGGAEEGDDANGDTNNSCP